MLRIETAGSRVAAHAWNRVQRRAGWRTKQQSFRVGGPPGFQTGLQPTDGKLLAGGGGQTYETVDAL